MTKSLLVCWFAARVAAAREQAPQQKEGDHQAHGAAGELAKGQVMQVLVEMASGYLFVSAISGGSTIGVVTARDSDLGLVGFEIALLVERVGAQLTPALITELKNSLVAV